MQTSDKRLVLSEFGYEYYLISGDVLPWVDQMKALRLGGKSTDTKMRVSGYLFKKTGKNALQKLTDFVNKANISMGYFTAASNNLIDPQGIKYQVMSYTIPEPYVGQRVIFNSNGHQLNYRVAEVHTGLERFIDRIVMTPLDQGSADNI